MAVPGETAFVEYGYRAKLLTTLEEVFKSEILEKKQWKTIEIGGSDLDTVSKAWVVAKKLDINVHEKAPSEEAEINYINILRSQKETEWVTPKP